nr:2-octaprenyl-3-methyl-6-methoxy-1,4-benzoquinol hydroxylase [Gammaproteobacteria bacterium]NIT64837.1 2-octaprenyl-3-methyl-6-methoxy-1,4-benzoquinol hydroxylase [Gammaproteobacteria bacterium]NIV21796.1 2-octaprenyl-3-methyl-6-methoxy-1,4-benzoquinol hydroxylase [Gammaproteobacteria bacterium]NIY33417.1 2-octaprenyl-3-methyl-6-methoxy-1,4-benzoquinol hydroxylase [Gammaproteobacteria bacterium]
ARSRVREQCGFPLRERDYGHSAIVATIRTGAGHGHTARQWFMPRGPLAFLPLTDGQRSERYCSIVWSQDHDVARELMDLDDEAFRGALGRASEGALGPVEWVGRRYSFPLYRRHAPEYVRPGVVLMGDAAHSIHPLAGQGVNLGFADAATLVEEIVRGVLRNLPVGHVSTLERYQRRRKPDNLAMMAGMEGFKRLFASDISLLRVLRNRGLSGVDRLLPVKKQIIRLAMDL